jgi:hypothetical protein
MIVTGTTDGVKQAHPHDILGPFLSERPIAIHPALSRALGSLDLAVIVQTVIESQSASDLGVAWIKDEELSTLTTIGIVALPGLRARLRAMGILEENTIPEFRSLRVDAALVAALVAGEIDGEVLPAPLDGPPSPTPPSPPLSPPPSPSQPSETPSAMGQRVPDPDPMERRRPAMIPEEYAPSDRAIKTVLGYPSITAEDVARETVAFVNHHRSKGTKFVDFDAAFRKWMQNTARFRERDGTPTATGTTVIRGSKPMSADRRRELERRAARGDTEARRELGR